MNTTKVFKGLKADIGNGDTLFIKQLGSGYATHVTPEYRHNGTQAWDGMLSRRYKTLNGAKIGMGLLLGKSILWEEM